MERKGRQPMKFTLSNSAERDLDKIYDYTVIQWSLTQADKYHHQLLTHCRLLANNPTLGKNVDDVPREYLSRKAEKHIIFYKVIAPDEILIVRILHGRMDLKNRIRE
jgi:toxin ParE1/3/4